MLKVLMVILVLIPVGLSAYLARSLYQRKGVPEALENLTRQLFQSKEDEHKAEKRAEQLERKTAELQSAYDALVADLHGEMDSKEVRIRRFKEALEINFVDKVLFASGSAEVTPHGRDVLSKVAGVLVKIKDKSIYVVGHTDTHAHSLGPVSVQLGAVHGPVLGRDPFFVRERRRGARALHRHGASLLPARGQQCHARGPAGKPSRGCDRGRRAVLGRCRPGQTLARAGGGTGRRAAERA
jgi:hypothetical protein